MRVRVLPPHPTSSLLTSAWGLWAFDRITVRETDEIPADVLPLAQEKRLELIEHLAEVDEQMSDLFLDEAEITPVDIASAIRRATIANDFTPVFLGSALANTGVQAMLDGVIAYLPDPSEVPNQALDTELPPNAPPVPLVPAAKAPLVGLAFKLEEGRFGQLTYMRIYQGTLKRGMTLFNARTGKKIKVPRLVRMHSADMEVRVVAAARFDSALWLTHVFCLARSRRSRVSAVERSAPCSVSTVRPETRSTTVRRPTRWYVFLAFSPVQGFLTFTSPFDLAPARKDVDVRARARRLACPYANWKGLAPVLQGAQQVHQGGPHLPSSRRQGVVRGASSSILPVLLPFEPVRSDHPDLLPTDAQTIISGMGELHLEIYVERLRREYNVECTTGRPRVAFRETIAQRAEFDFTHKKQTGGSGQFAKIKGYVEPMEIDPENQGIDVEFESRIIAGAIPAGFIPAIEKVRF